MYDLAERTVFVTGATAGIGLACAEAAARAGAAVVICGRREERLQAVARALRADLGADCHGVVLDVRDSSAVGQAVKELPERFAKIDVLVNNAGLGSGLGPLHTQSVEDFDVMVDTNVKGLLYVTRAVAKEMVERNYGHIINIGSVAGHDTYPGGTVYCATKFAVNAITKGLKMDLHGTNVRVTSIDPGIVETEFSVVRFHGDSERAKSVYSSTTPLEPADVADAVLYCATRPERVNVGTLILTTVMQSSVSMIDRSGRRLDSESGK